MKPEYFEKLGNIMYDVVAMLANCQEKRAFHKSHGGKTNKLFENYMVKSTYRFLKAITLYCM